MREKYLVTADGLTLLHRIFEPPRQTEWVCCGTHTQAQHSLNLAATYDAIAQKGWTVHVTDLRGHGFSVGPKAPLAHMDVGTGWDTLVGDLRLSYEYAFRNVPYEKRLIVAPNIGAPLTLEILKTWPDLAARIVFSSSPTNQKALLQLSKSYAAVRLEHHPADAPDSLSLNQLYSFLGSHLDDERDLIKVVSSDPEIIAALQDDPRAWPTPTTGYFHEMFHGIDKAWTWGDGASVDPRTQFLLLHGGDDPMTAHGHYLQPMIEQLYSIGASHVESKKIPGGRSGLLIEEKRFGLSQLIDDWVKRQNSFLPDPISEPALASPEISGSILARIGARRTDEALTPAELVEICYAAIDDKSRSSEALHRLLFALGESEIVDTQRLEQTLKQIMPHLDRSHAVSRQVLQSAAIGAVLQNVLSRFQIGLAVINDDLEMSYANEVFLSTLLQMDVLPFDRLEGQEFGPLTQWLRATANDAFLSATRSSTGEAPLIVDNEPIGFYFRPRALLQTSLSIGGASGVIVLRPPTGADMSNARRDFLKLAYSLTDKEVNVALLILRGHSPAAISEMEAISINTVRTHLKATYEKVGVRGQAELVSRVLNGPVGLITGDVN